MFHEYNDLTTFQTPLVSLLRAQFCIYISQMYNTSAASWFMLTHPIELSRITCLGMILQSVPKLTHHFFHNIWWYSGKAKYDRVNYL